MNIIELNDSNIPFSKSELEKNNFLPIALSDEEGNFYTLCNESKIYKTNKTIFVESVRQIFQSQKNAHLPRSIKSIQKKRYEKMKQLMKSIPIFLNNRYLMEVETLQKTFLFKQYNEINFLLKQQLTGLTKSHFEYMAPDVAARQNAYGNGNLNSTLFEKYGVYIKKQDNSEFSQTELSEANEIISEVFTFFKIQKSFMQKNNLKISFTHNKSMKTIKASGVFIENYKSIGVPFSNAANRGIEEPKIILAHEIGHWIDLAFGQGVIFSSGKAGTISNLLAQSFFRNMKNRNKASDYWKSTTECFARAMEEFFAVENYNSESYFSKSYYCNQKDYEEKIKPLVKLIIENLECM